MNISTALMIVLGFILFWMGLITALANKIARRNVAPSLITMLIGGVMLLVPFIFYKDVSGFHAIAIAFAESVAWGIGRP